MPPLGHAQHGAERVFHVQKRGFAVFMEQRAQHDVERQLHRFGVHVDQFACGHLRLPALQHRVGRLHDPFGEFGEVAAGENGRGPPGGHSSQ